MNHDYCSIYQIDIYTDCKILACCRRDDADVDDRETRRARLGAGLELTKSSFTFFNFAQIDHVRPDLVLRSPQNTEQGLKGRSPLWEHVNLALFAQCSSAQNSS